jgi:hypothetical protein
MIIAAMILCAGMTFFIMHIIEMMHHQQHPAAPRSAAAVAEDRIERLAPMVLNPRRHWTAVTSPVAPPEPTTARLPGGRERG